MPRRGGREKDVPAATRVVADNSVREFWDGDDLLGIEHSKCSGGGAMRGTFTCSMDPRHSGTAICPAPGFFMHQTSEKDPRLDADEFGKRVKRLL